MTVSRWLDALVGDAEIEARFSDEADLAAMLRMEAALAGAEVESGLISIEGSERIAAVCADFTPDHAALGRGMARDGVVIPTLVAQLRAAVGEPNAAALHRGATSQDIIDTSLVLRLKEVTHLLEQRLGDLIGRFAALAARDGTRPAMAHTRMQVALPVTAADKIESWVAPLRRHLERIDTIKPRLFVLQLGGPVGTRAELGKAAARIAHDTAARLDLAPAAPWHAQRDSLAEWAGWLSLVTGTLGKFGQDLALLAQNEVAAVRLAGGGGSSAMAHKQNPVGAEVLVALARLNAGLLGILHQSLVHENERSGAAWTLEWMVLPRMAVATGAALRSAATLVDGLRFT